MGTELAKAYVQIVPSAQGISGKITQELGGEAEAAGKSAGSTIAGTIKSAIVAAGIGTVLKQTLSEGAALEQSIGGIETSFKDSAEEVKAAAANAYKTAGMSANEYMEAVTGFSASLLQGLGGDTAQAAKVADMALTDMSDNANKMGTSMELIQNAYQGFAKQNYTMLDNLKLGYGGTKTEMQRLLKDAQELTGVEYNIDNLSDVYSAIHAIQVEMDITGTTAKEASSTLAGSFASMKAAATNVLGDLALGKDVGPALKGLTESVVVFLGDNLLPAIGNVLQGLPTILSTLVVDMGPQLFQSALQFVVSFVSGIIDAIPEFLTGLERMVTDGLALLDSEGGSGFLQRGLDLIRGLAEGLLQNLPLALGVVGNILKSLITFLIDNLPEWTKQGISMIAELAVGILSNLPEAIGSIASLITDLLFSIGSSLPEFLEKGLELVGEVVAGIIAAIPSAVAAIPKLIVDVAAKFLDYDWRSIGGNIISGVANGILGGVGSIIEAAKGAANSAFQAAKKALGIASPSRVMRDQIGKYIPLGLAEGIKGNLKPVASVMEEMTKIATDVPQADVVAAAKINSDISRNTGYSPVNRVSSIEGVTFNIYAAEGHDTREIAEEVSRILTEMTERQLEVFT